MTPPTGARVAAGLVALMVSVAGAPWASASSWVWTWKAAGTLSTASTCSKKAQHALRDECLYRLPDPTRTSGTVTGVISVTNNGSHRTCYGVSLSTSYLGGLQSFCVRGHTVAEYMTKGPAAHYLDTQLALFVTSGSKTQPIQPLADASPSPFTITFHERA